MFACVGGLLHHIAVVGAPPHDGCLGAKPVVGYLIPADKSAAIVAEKELHAAHKPCLQLLWRFEPFLSHAARTVGAVMPAAFLHFISADMNIFRRKNLKQFCKYVLAKFYCGVFAGAYRTVGYAATCQLIMHGGQHKAMPGHIEFGHNLNTAPGGEVYDMAQISLGVETAIYGVALLIGGHAVSRQAHGRIFGRRFLAGKVVFVEFSPCSFGGELRVAVRLHAPALVVDKVPVEYRHFIQRHKIDILLNLGYCPEMACRVEVHASPPEVGGVGYAKARQGQALGLYGH